MDSPWDEDPDSTTLQDAEWSRLSSDFTNVGYREGITAGKEGASQEGFDDGFANVGVPIGRELGLLRGMATVVLHHLKPESTDAARRDDDAALAEAHDIAAQLARVRFSDIAPRDLEAEAHAREHMEAADGSPPPEVQGEIAAKRDVEVVEDMLAGMTAGNGKARGASVRPTMDDVRALGVRLRALSERLGLKIDGGN